MGDKPNTSLVEILLIPKHNPEWMEQQRQLNETKANDGCTFRPKTLTYNSTAQRPASHGDRNADLYNTKSKGWVKDKVLKSSSEYDFEKSERDCTFAPKINDPNRLAVIADVGQVAGMSQMYQRMEKAR